jgi:hypothetical protein
MRRQTVEAQERSIPNPFQDATAQGARRRPHFSLHFGLHFSRSKSLILVHWRPLVAAMSASVRKLR